MALRGRVELTEGFAYRDESVTPAEELELIELAAGVDMHHVVIRDQPSRRLVRRFGYGHEHESFKAREGEPKQPHVPPTRGDRHSITFRTLRRACAAA